MRSPLCRLFLVAFALGSLVCPATAQVQDDAGPADLRLEAALRSRLFDGPVPAVVAPQADPDSTEWEQARAAGHHPDCADVGPLRYVQRQEDLNGDGLPERLVLVVGSYACGSRGCTLMIFREGSNTLEVVAENGLFQSPLQRLSVQHFGWNDLGMPASRDGAASGWRELQFDGLAYRPGRLLPQAPLAGSSLQASLFSLPEQPFERLGHPLLCRAR